MKFKQTEVHTKVILSRRNLLALLSKLDMEGSNKCIMNSFDDEMGCKVLSVWAEEDAEHYKDREPGPMHPQTEVDIKNYHWGH